MPLGPQPVGRVRSIALQICASLGEAHQQNLVHRDLKPSNVMLCKLALTYDFIKVLDFGLAKCAACEDIVQLTMEGTAAGTPGRVYGTFEVGVTADRGRTTPLGYPVWMPEIDVHNAVPIPAVLSSEMVITSPRIPGLEVRLPTEGSA